MSKIAIVADVHIGNHKTLGGTTVSRMNDRCRETIRVLRAACERAKHEGCDAMVVLGDLFDTDYPLPAIVRATMEALKSGPPRVILLLGNHEMHSGQENDHALASMVGSWDGVKISVIDRPTISYVGQDLALLLIPFKPGNAESWLREQIKVAGVRRGGELLCFHLGISDSVTARTEPWMMGSHDQVSVDTLCDLIDEFDFSGVAAGNWHQHMLWEADDGQPILQTGALCPTGWNNQGGDDLYGTLAIWDGEQFERIVIPGPRYMKFTKLREWRKHAGDERIRARLVVPNGKEGVAEEHVRAENPLGYVEIVPKSSEKNTIAAAIATRAAAGSDKGLSDYIRSMDLPDNVDPATIFQAAKTYLRNAR